MMGVRGSVSRAALRSWDLKSRTPLRYSISLSLKTLYRFLGFDSIPSCSKRLTQIASSNVAIVGISGSWVPTSFLRGVYASPLALKVAIAHLDVRIQMEKLLGTGYDDYVSRKWLKLRNQNFRHEGDGNSFRFGSMLFLSPKRLD